MKPYYEADGITIYHGDCREILPRLVSADLVVTDPPYGDTSLEWDRRCDGWIGAIGPHTWVPQMWCFGSLRSVLATGAEFTAAGWKLAQEVVWEKHNGSGFHADRFKRVHELAVHWYRGKWSRSYRNPPVTMDATPRTVRRKTRPTHIGRIESSVYESHDGGPRLMRSVQRVRSEHGRAVHPTQKPLGILRPLIKHSCPPGGMVLDPFVGSGSTLLAARELGRRAIGIELDERYCEMAAKRLGQMVLDVGTAA